MNHTHPSFCRQKVGSWAGYLRDDVVFSTSKKRKSKHCSRLATPLLSLFSLFSLRSNLPETCWVRFGTLPSLQRRYLIPLLSSIFCFFFFLFGFRENEEKDRIFRKFSSFFFHLSRTAALGSVEWSFLVYRRTIKICKDLEIQFISFWCNF